MRTVPELPLAGGCLCGRIRFETETAPILASACHCRGCQRLTGSAFSLSISVLSDGFKVFEGKPVIGALHKAEARYWFCDWCKCWLYTEPPSEFGFVNLRTTMLDDPHGFDPFLEVWTGEKLDWVQTPAIHSFEKEPSIETYRSIVDEYVKS